MSRFQNDDYLRQIDELIKEMEKSRPSVPCTEQVEEIPAADTAAYQGRQLIIGLGGAGIAALLAVRKHLEQVFPPAELNRLARFLAVDSDLSSKQTSQTVPMPDGSTQVRTVDIPADYLYLNPQMARMHLYHAPAWLDSQVKEYVNMGFALDGNGASAIPQLGRYLLYTQPNALNIQCALQAQIEDLTCGNSLPLHISLLTGISGGTGAGCVVDLTYLIRDSISPSLRNRVLIHGYILMPSTGIAWDRLSIQRGNAIGQAALKEINRCMALPNSGSAYTFTYSDGYTVTSQAPVFDDLCQLEGRTKTTAYANPRKFALDTLAETLGGRIIRGNPI